MCRSCRGASPRRGGRRRGVRQLGDCVAALVDDPARVAAVVPHRGFPPRVEVPLRTHLVRLLLSRVDPYHLAGGKVRVGSERIGSEDEEILEDSRGARRIDQPVLDLAPVQVERAARGVDDLDELAVGVHVVAGGVGQDRQDVRASPAARSPPGGRRPATPSERGSPRPSVRSARPSFPRRCLEPRLPSASC